MTPIKHIGIIMDGNRRWAKSRRLPAREGYRAGYKKVEEVLKWCKEANIKIVTLFAFSTENWKRSEKEVSLLMLLFYKALTKDIKKLHKENIKVRIIGRKEEFSKKVREAIHDAETLTEKNTGVTLNLAVNYGGRQEMVDACQAILAHPPKKITEDVLANHMYTAGLPNPDIIIRTSGEMRLSGFLLWQSAYSELYFLKHCWPEFSKKDFDNILDDFKKRHRRFGK